MDFEMRCSRCKRSASSLFLSGRLGKLRCLSCLRLPSNPVVVSTSSSSYTASQPEEHCSLNLNRWSILGITGLSTPSLIMSQEGTISLREQPLATEDFSIEEPRFTNQEPPDLDQRASTRHGSTMRRACVLMGNGLLQLPIWGTQEAD